MEREHLVWDEQRLVRDSEWEYSAPQSKFWYADVPKELWDEVDEILKSYSGCQYYYQYQPDYNFPHVEVWVEFEEPQWQPCSLGLWKMGGQ